MLVEIRRTYRFCASHRLCRPEWDDARNEEVFGPAGRSGGHGHNFRLTLVVAGTPDSLTGRVVDVERLDRIVDEQVLQPFDHRNLNVDVPELAGQVPTAERIVLEIWRRLQPRVPSGTLTEVLLHQGEFLAAACRGDA